MKSINLASLHHRLKCLAVCEPCMNEQLIQKVCKTFVRQIINKIDTIKSKVV